MNPVKASDNGRGGRGGRARRTRRRRASRTHGAAGGSDGNDAIYMVDKVLDRRIVDAKVCVTFGFFYCFALLGKLYSFFCQSIPSGGILHSMGWLRFGCKYLGARGKYPSELT